MDKYEKVNAGKNNSLTFSQMFMLSELEINCTMQHYDKTSNPVKGFNTSGSIIPLAV